MSQEKIWEMTFDLNTLEHLGVKLYTQYPPMIAELLSNSWDADAKNVEIHLYDKDVKKIIVKDDGHGMGIDEINSHFLTVGRNRRVNSGIGTSTGGRLVLGKKGIGKLSMFGIAEKITITTIQSGKKNSFCMIYSDMKKSGGSYSPTPVCVNEETTEGDGTEIILDNIKRKSDFNPKVLGNSLSKRFSIFDAINVDIYRNEDLTEKVENKEEYEGIDNQFTWVFPVDFIELIDDIKYYKDRGVCGKLMTSMTPLKKNQQGVTLLARGKLVQENAYFDDRSNDYFHSYLYGSLNVDFIDEDNEDDNVSTDRKSLIWEGDELETLRDKLNDILKCISKEWRDKRVKTKKDNFKINHGIDVDDWIKGLSAAEKPLAKKISSSILNNTKMDNEKSASLFNYIQDAFSLEGFKEFAESLDDLGVLEEDVAIKLLEDWNFIEAKEMAKLSEGRINTINQFEKYINANVSETKVMQKFLENFPWILDPRMTNFEREVTYSKWLRENFPEDKLEESNKRIDFLCSNNNGIVHIIELKRPKIKIGSDEINQCAQYQEFIEKKCPDTVREVKTILISENHNYSPGVTKQVEALTRNGDFEIKSYSDLLSAARQYHKEYINKYDELMVIKSKLDIPEQG